MNAGPLRHKVSLANATTTTPDADGFYEDLDPRDVWARIDPGPPQTVGDRTIIHNVTIRYHAQVGLETRILFGSRQLFVRGVQNVDSMNVELRLLCEEVI